MLLKRNCGAPLLGLAKYVYQQEMVKIWQRQFSTQNGVKPSLEEKRSF